jgi:hypothetical protein
MPDHGPSPQAVPSREFGVLWPVLGGALLALLALSIATVAPRLVSGILGAGVLIAIIAAIASLTYKMLTRGRNSGPRTNDAPSGPSGPGSGWPPHQAPRHACTDHPAG